jgi:hypothetical protein
VFDVIVLFTKVDRLKLHLEVQQYKSFIALSMQPTALFHLVTDLLGSLLLV